MSLKNFNEYMEQAEKEKIDTVFVDMDGVLADLKAAMREKGISFDWEKGLRRTNPGEFFKMAKEEKLFEKLPVLPFNEIFKFLKKQNVKVKILGSIGNKSNEILKEHKTNWLKEKINFEFDEIIFVPGKRFKKDYATPTSILIDDTQSNIDTFIQAGGIAILHKNEKETLEKLKEYF